jgi:hypothetical protein
MSIEPVTITTTHDTPLFDPDDHRAAAAEQLGLTPTEIHCIGCGPAEVRPNLFSEDGTVLQHRVISYSRKTTWEPVPRVKRAPEPERVMVPELEHYIPKLSRGARWHGIKDGIEGNYISTGDDLVLIDSAEGLTVLSDMHREDVAYARGISGESVG